VTARVMQSQSASLSSSNCLTYTRARDSATYPPQQTASMTLPKEVMCRIISTVFKQALSTVPMAALLDSTDRAYETYTEFHPTLLARINNRNRLVFYSAHKVVTFLNKVTQSHIGDTKNHSDAIALLSAFCKCTRVSIGSGRYGTEDQLAGEFKLRLNDKGLVFVLPEWRHAHGLAAACGSISIGEAMTMLWYSEKSEPMSTTASAAATPTHGASAPRYGQKPLHGREPGVSAAQYLQLRHALPNVLLFAAMISTISSLASGGIP
jgi:hypothetical protein